MTARATTSKPFNPWPYSIVGFFALAIIAAIGWVVFCIGQDSDLVALDYYEQEVEYQKQMERIQRGQALSSVAGVQYEPSDHRLRLQLPPEHANDRLQGRIRLYRPSEANLDQFVLLEVDENGLQFIKTDSLKAGLWDIRVEWMFEGQEYYLSEKITITPSSS